MNRIRLDDPVLIQGLPGLGFVGKVTVGYLLEKLDTTKLGELYSRFLTLPDGNLGVTVKRDGTYSLPKYEFYAYTKRGPDIIFLTGDTQPQYWGQFEIAENVLNYVEGFGSRTIVAVGGYGTRSRREVGAVYAITNDATMLEELKKYGVRTANSGAIRGAFGVIMGSAKQRGMRCLGLLGATRGIYPDVYASRTIVRVISDMYSLPVSLEDLDAQVEDMGGKLRRLREIRSEVSRVAEGRARKEPPSEYIA
ncbi:MAG: PAC2 family protein [Candidatus Bathyarchaeia archaeon]